jgi:hypothetical protein
MIRIVSPDSVCDDKNSAKGRQADDQKPPLADGIVDVWKCCRQWIVKDRRRLPKIDAVLLETRFGLFGIPCERHRISLRRVRPASLGCLTRDAEPRGSAKRNTSPSRDGSSARLGGAG